MEPERKRNRNYNKHNLSLSTFSNVDVSTTSHSIIQVKRLIIVVFKHKSVNAKKMDKRGIKTLSQS